jgi:hypothetical protein
VLLLFSILAARGGGRSRGRRKLWRGAAMGGEDGQTSDTTDDSDLASNGPQPFSHIHAPKINLWQHFFWDITQNKRHQVVVVLVVDLVSHFIEEKGSLGLSDRLREGKG